MEYIDHCVHGTSCFCTLSASALIHALSHASLHQLDSSLEIFLWRLVSHTCICSWITRCISLIHILHIHIHTSAYLNTQVGHADHNCMLFSAALNLTLLLSESYHQYVINSNLLLKTNQVIFEMTLIIRYLRRKY